jgi:hypothetical protein
MKFISGNSGEHNLSPEFQSLSPYLDNLSPVLDKVISGQNQDLSTKTNNSGYTGYTGYKFDYILEENEDISRIQLQIHTN